MPSVYLATDKSCWNRDRIGYNLLGGTENFFMRLRDWLAFNGLDVFDPVYHPTGDEVDVAIYSNVYDPSIKAKANILWGGSWHATVHEPNIDKVILVSEFMKREMKCERAKVIPVPYEQILIYHQGPGLAVKGRIISTANPNRWYAFAPDVVRALERRNVGYEWHFCGGNKLYGEHFGELFSFSSEGSGPHYGGILTKATLFRFLSSAHVWIYPNFEDNPETFALAVVEPAVLGIPVILPRREPFTEVLPEAIFVDSPEEMADVASYILRGQPERNLMDLSRYSERVVFPQIIVEIKSLL